MVFRKMILTRPIRTLFMQLLLLALFLQLEASYSVFWRDASLRLLWDGTIIPFYLPWLTPLRLDPPCWTTEALTFGVDLALCTGIHYPSICGKIWAGSTSSSCTFNSYSFSESSYFLQSTNSWIDRTKVSIATLTLWLATAASTKVSLLLLYHRLFYPSKRFRLVVRIGAAIVFCQWFSLTIGTIFQCIPVAAFWNRNIEGAKCIDLPRFTITSGVLNLLTDVMILCLPVPMLWGLNTTKAQKVTLTGIFLLGILYVLWLFRLPCLTTLQRVYHLNRPNLPTRCCDLRRSNMAYCGRKCLDHHGEQCGNSLSLSSLHAYMKLSSYVLIIAKLIPLKDHSLDASFLVDQRSNLPIRKIAGLILSVWQKLSSIVFSRSQSPISPPKAFQTWKKAPGRAPIWPQASNSPPCTRLRRYLYNI